MGATASWEHQTCTFLCRRRRRPARRRQEEVTVRHGAGAVERRPAFPPRSLRNVCTFARDVPGRRALGFGSRQEGHIPWHACARAARSQSRGSTHSKGAPVETYDCAAHPDPQHTEPVLRSVLVGRVHGAPTRAYLERPAVTPAVSGTTAPETQHELPQLTAVLARRDAPVLGRATA